MSLFTGEPTAPRDDRCRVWIVTKPWMLGFWFVYVADYDDTVLGFTRAGFTRSRGAALDLAKRWLEAMIKRHARYRPGTNSG